MIDPSIVAGALRSKGRTAYRGSYGQEARIQYHDFKIWITSQDWRNTVNSQLWKLPVALRSSFEQEL